jgi:AraC family transcriptional regulator
MPLSPSPTLRKALLSQQVTGSRYFFLDLAPRPGCRWTLALGGREQCNPDYVVDRSGYAYHVLEYVAEGAGEAILDGERSALEAGTLLTYAPQTRCLLRTEPQRPMLKYFFALAGRGVRARLDRAGLAPGRVRKLSAHAEIRTVAEDLIREGQRSGPLTLDLCLALLELFLLKFADAASWAGHGSTLAQANFLRCKALIDAHAERYATLDEIAAEAGMEVTSMCRLFRRFQGTSPYQYLLRRKMNIAAEFLVDSGGLVKEAAQRVGFADPFHFARCFKAVHGVPPSALRGYRQ